MNMSTTVIIPAFNEEAHIEKTLRSLPNSVRPIVTINGSTDRTAEIAESFGAETFVREEQGKLPAIQETLRQLGREALEPIIILDADSQPLFPKLWTKHMIKPLYESPDRPAAVGGLSIHTRHRFATGALRTAYRAAHVGLYNIPALDRPARKPIPQAGPNMSIRLHDTDTLDAVLDLPHYWPGEDRAMIDTIKQHDGRYLASLNPLTTVATPVSESYTGLVETFRMGLRKTNQVIEAAYAERGADGSIVYRSPQQGTYRPLS